MPIVITGATGHVGNTLVRLALHRGYSVRAVQHRSTKPLADLSGHDRLEVVTGDIQDPASLRSAFDGAEYVVHCAALISIVGDPKGDVRRMNVDGARNTAQAAKDAGVRRFVHISSVHAFAQGKPGPLSEGSPRPSKQHPAYDQSKAAGEAAVREVTADGAMEACMLNPTGVLGPFDYGPSRMGAMWTQLARHGLPSLVPGGFDWVDVRDLAAGILSALEHGRHHENYLMSGTWASIGELATLAQAMTHTAPPRLTVPFWLAYLGAPFMVAYANLTGTEPLYTADALFTLQNGSRVVSDKARSELGFETRPLRDTVRDSHRWLATHGFLSINGEPTRSQEDFLP